MARKIDVLVRELKRSIKERTGEDCPSWLMPMVRSTAMQMVILEKLQDELAQNGMTSIETGSKGQQKTIANPLLVAYKECQRTVGTHLEKLGLTFSATPSKMTESTRKGMDENDPMKALIDAWREI